MAFGTAGEGISHVTAVRMRILGSGVLDMTLQSLQEVRELELTGFQMSEETEIQPTRLTNFQQQRFKLRGEVDTINEFFEISTIIFFVKTVATSYPAVYDAIPT